MIMFEFERESWRLRAVLCEDVEVLGDSDFEDETQVYMWFVADPTHDQWFAHGISDTSNDVIADAVGQAIEPQEMSSLLAYAGEPWKHIEIAPVAFGGQQRALWAGLKGDPIDRLMSMSRDEILALREVEIGKDKAVWNDSSV